jgi:hypothetical protein
MHDARFDTLVRRFRPGTTRRRALRLLGGTVLAGALSPALVPDVVEAGAKKRCKKKQGVVVGKGQCTCALTCTSNPNKFECPNHRGCTCFEAVDGTGICGTGEFASSGCSTNADCDPGSICTMLRGCSAQLPCTSPLTCLEGQGCIRGTCQPTACLAPCV